MPKKNKRKEAPHILFYFISIIITIITHHFFLSRLNMGSTINLVFAFVVFTFILGFMENFYEKFSKNK